MTHPVLARLAGCLATGLVVTVFIPLTFTAPAAAADTAPLEVSIDSMSPSVIPERGAITVTGTVTNHSDDEWTDLNVYLLTSAEPFTTADELDAAAVTDPAVEIGSRLTGAGLYAEIGDLAPGASVNYALSVTRKDVQLSGAPGVYWLGVHVLGANADGRDSAADGRARSFIPLMDRKGPETTMSLVVPIKNPVRRNADGSLKNLAGWQELLSPEGRLGRLLQLTGTPTGVPVTSVVDPAVLDAATSVAGDNPPMSTAPADGQGTTPTPGESTSPTPTDEPAADPGADEPADLSEEAKAAATWLDLFVSQSDQNTVLSVPYGDLDLAAVMRGGFKEIYDQANDLSTQTMERLGVAASPVVAPPSGYLPNAALPDLDPKTPVILSDVAAPESEVSLIDGDLGHQIVLTDSTADDGGPGPTPAFNALAMRQRILSAAAVHALSGPADQPLFVSMPQDWDPGVEWRLAEFFSGFEVPWLRTLDLPTATALATALATDTGYDAKLVYPRVERRAELTLANLLATEELSETGRVFANLLTRDDTVDEDLARSAVLASSYQARTRPHAAVVRARGTTASIRSLMEQVSIDGPAFVTMSSEAGTFAVTIINELSEPVTVGIEAQTGTDELVIASPEPVTLGAGQRATVRLKATSLNIGVSSVTLMATNADGQPIGSATTFNVRSSQVGLVIWVIMGLGAAVLFTASGIRIVRRIRARNAEHGPVLEETSP